MGTKGAVAANGAICERAICERRDLRTRDLRTRGRSALEPLRITTVDDSHKLAEVATVNVTNSSDARGREVVTGTMGTRQPLAQLAPTK